MGGGDDDAELGVVTGTGVTGEFVNEVGWAEAGTTSLKLIFSGVGGGGVGGLGMEVTMAGSGGGSLGSRRRPSLTVATEKALSAR